MATTSEFLALISKKVEADHSYVSFNGSVVDPSSEGGDRFDLVFDYDYNDGSTSFTSAERTVPVPKALLTVANADTVIDRYASNISVFVGQDILDGGGVPGPADLAPIIDAIADDAIAEHTPYEGSEVPTPSLTQGTSPVVWSLVSGPTGMTIDTSTGVVSWPDPTPTGVYTLTIRASNSQGSDDESWDLTVS